MESEKKPTMVRAFEDFRVTDVSNRLRNYSLHPPIISQIKSHTIDMVNWSQFFGSLAGGVVGFCTVYFVNIAYNSFKTRLSRSKLQAISPSALVHALRVNAAEEWDLTPYHANEFPNERDVRSLHGSVRVYEFGDVQGPKVLLIHDIDLPCVSLKKLANKLAVKGWRVLLFDLYGRGFSDSPTYHPHTASIYHTQIFAVLASSPLAWIGSNNNFTIIGHSYGAAIAASFADNFPLMVKSLVLIAPMGLSRAKKMPLWYRLCSLWPGDPTGFIMRNLVRNKLLESTRDVTLVNWQLEKHAGYLDAVASDMRYGPMVEQFKTFASIGSRLYKTKEQDGHPTGDPLSFLGGKVIVAFGTEDKVTLFTASERNFNLYLGASNIEVIKIQGGGHDLPTSHAMELVDHICTYADKHSKELDHYGKVYL